MSMSIGAIGSNSQLNDPEYIFIAHELQKLGIKPTGKKNIDQTRLLAEKKKLVQHIQEKMETKQPENNPDAEKMANLELQRPGAMTVAELNKILHGLV